MSLASPPCFAHELVETADGFAAVDRRAAADVVRWRRAERQRLTAARLALPAHERRWHALAIAGQLEPIVTAHPHAAVAVYWPIRGEPDLRPWMRSLAARGVRVALPVVERPERPLAFRAWRPGCRLARGVWDIPVPADGEELVPRIVIVPLVGFDHDCYRLGHGGGYYDRTLAALAPRPLAVGVGYPGAAVATIYPQPHDIPMDVIVTGDGEPRRRGFRP